MTQLRLADIFKAVTEEAEGKPFTALDRFAADARETQKKAKNKKKISPAKRPASQK